MSGGRWISRWVPSPSTGNVTTTHVSSRSQSSSTTRASSCAARGLRLTCSPSCGLSRGRCGCVCWVRLPSSGWHWSCSSISPPVRKENSGRQGIPGDRIWCNPWMPLSGSRRVVTAAWLLACLIFLSSFSSTLTAMLTVPLVRLPIDSMEDLVGQTAIPWAIESGGFLYQILYTATDGLYKTIWDGHSARITDCYTFRQDIGDGKYAAICDKMTMKKVMSEDFSVRGECNYYMAREDFKAMPLALAFQHHHPFYSQANQRILELVNKGLVDRWIQEQLPNGTACLSPPGSDLVGAKRPLSLKDYYGLFSMFGICMLAWSLVLCVEVVLAAASSRSYRSFHSHLLARITKKNSYTNSTGSLSK
ncbi:glutamate receptor ionotropic, delta-2-like isoform X5 [Scylla paramamosain]|uniref:glutamate receptor ionotropic, delta-2-like isoform X5 n=1 Tax=Scylla paramamosain TaxID=85552 RepID=UPI003083960F